MSNSELMSIVLPSMIWMSTSICQYHGIEPLSIFSQKLTFTSAKNVLKVALYGLRFTSAKNALKVELYVKFRVNVNCMCF